MQRKSTAVILTLLLVLMAGVFRRADGKRKTA